MPELVLCGGDAEPLRSKLKGREGFDALPFINTELECRSARGFHAIELSSDRVAFLQYTSGSTSAPKGVMVGHGNLHANAVALAESFGVTRKSVLVSWLPLYHDMGLMGTVLQTVFSGATCVLMAPAAFLQKPVRWLRALSNYGGTHSAAPSFAYDLCVDRIGLEESEEIDLSRWECAANGAEPVRAQTIARFLDRFAQNGFRRQAFRPCYGLAEATLLVAAESKAPTTIEVDGKLLEQHRAIPAASRGSPSSVPRRRFATPWTSSRST
jgi:acyl-CoA synthetase (AMP-forming)/AMP-acid ligase II